MYPRPAVGSVGLTLGALAPDGLAEFHGLPFQVRAEGGTTIDSGQAVVVTGFDPRSLIVRPATAEEVASQPPPSADAPANATGGGILLTVLGGIIFLLGVGLFLGNTSGLFPTVPFAGFVLMTIGGAMFGAGMRAAAQG